MTKIENVPNDKTAEVKKGMSETTKRHLKWVICAACAGMNQGSA